MPEFLTIAQLAQGFKVSEKVIRHAFKKLFKEGSLVEGEDFIREGYKDDLHFVYKIHPGRFAVRTHLFPTVAPVPPLDTQHTDTATYVGSTATKLDSTDEVPGSIVDSQEDDPATNAVSKDHDRGSNFATTTERRLAAEGNYLHEYLRAKDEQITLLREQIDDLKKQMEKKDDQIAFKDRLIEGSREDQSSARHLIQIMTERVVEMSKRALPSATHRESSGSNNRESATNFDSHHDDPATNAGNNDHDGGSNFATRPPEEGTFYI
jgi:hypothetical protein